VRRYRCCLFITVSFFQFALDRPALAGEPNVQPGAAEQAETLRVTVGTPTFLSSRVSQGRASVTVSRTGVVAAFYPKPETGPKFCRTSTDAGQTWSEEIEPDTQAVTPMSIGLREGGVLSMVSATSPVKGGKPGELHASRIVFSDDFTTCEGGRSTVFIPKAALNVRWAKFWPQFDSAKIIQLPSGDLMAPMYGNFKGDAQYRTFIVRSSDLGKSWSYHDTVAYNPKDPNPEFVGWWCGYCEPSLALLPDGRFLCVMRTQGAQYNGEYRPLYASWSDVQGKNWTKPVPTRPHLKNIWPTLAVLDNGVVACQYGRPGVHVAFSVDGGRTWQDHVAFSNLSMPTMTGQGDMVKVGPNRLVVIGTDAEGIKVWPIDVERETVSPAHTTLTGRVLDENGHPLAGAMIERSPNRYDTSDWRAIPTKNSHTSYYEPHFRQPMNGSIPTVAYRSIRKANNFPIVRTSSNGQFRFDDAKFGEYILTVEADGYAPQHRHIHHRPQPKPHDFSLKPGRRIVSRVVDQSGEPVSGACVVLDTWHTHTDVDGHFAFSVQSPVPNQFPLMLYKRYVKQYGLVKQNVSLSKLEKQTIQLPHKD